MRASTFVLLTVIVTGPGQAASTVEWFGKDLAVRDFVRQGFANRGNPGYLWLATDRGLYFLEPGSEAAALKRPPALAGDFQAVAYGPAAGNMTLWLVSPQGLIEWPEVEQVPIAIREIPLPEAGRSGRTPGAPRTTYTLPPVLSLCSAGEHMYLGTGDGIVELNSRLNAWAVAKNYFRWLGFAGGLLVNSGAITNCRQILVDRQDRIWALTDEGLIVSGPRYGQWGTGYTVTCPGGAAVSVVANAFATGKGEGILGDGVWRGRPVALGLDVRGNLTMLMPDRHLSQEPVLPQDNKTAVILGTFPDLPGTGWLQAEPGQPTQFALGGGRVAVALRREGNSVVCVADAAGSSVQEHPLGDTRVNRLAFNDDGSVLWIATDRGLARVKSD